MDIFQTELYIKGINYKTAPIEIREKTAVDESALKELLDYNIVILSTCNRVEFYYSDSKNDKVFTEYFLKKGVSKDMIYNYKGIEAFKHLILVASGLDSLILGENEIMNQLRTAYKTSFEKLNPQMKRIFEKCFEIAKRIRSGFSFSGPRSIPEAIIKIAYKIFGDLNRIILVIGAGEIIEVFLENISDKNPIKVYLTNRTTEHAVEVANKFKSLNIEVLDYGLYKDYLKNIDILVTAVSGGLIISKEDINSFKNPLFIADMGIPRNVSNELNKTSGIFLFNIDDLKEIVNYNTKKISEEIIKAQKAIDNFINELKA